MTPSFSELATESYRIPDFFIVGAPKAGTTSLYNYLTQHPDVFMPRRKEPYFFGHLRERSGEDLREYLELFRGVPESKAAGEASTTYLYLEAAVEEIREFNPGAKIIIGVRNPIDRAYSHYWHHIRSGEISASFEESLKEEARHSRELGGDIRPGVVGPLSYYVEPGHYKKHIERYMSTFGVDQVMVYLFEDLANEPERVCCEVFEFLGVEPDLSVSTGQLYNTGGVPRSRLLHRLLYSPMRIKEPVKNVLPRRSLDGMRAVKERVRQKNFQRVPDMSQETRAYLREVFREDILYVEELMDRDLSHWLEGQ